MWPLQLDPFLWILRIYTEATDVLDVLREIMRRTASYILFVRLNKWSLFYPSLCKFPLQCKNLAWPWRAHHATASDNWLSTQINASDETTLFIQILNIEYQYVNEHHLCSFKKTQCSECTLDGHLAALGCTTAQGGAFKKIIGYLLKFKAQTTLAPS